jgi:hypothetical protein
MIWPTTSVHKFLPEDRHHIFSSIITTTHIHIDSCLKSSFLTLQCTYLKREREHIMCVWWRGSIELPYCLLHMQNPKPQTLNPKHTPNNRNSYAWADFNLLQLP